VNLSGCPITLEDARAARDRIAPYLERTPLRAYLELDAAVGHDIHVFVKHENHLPTNSFKVRNSIAALTGLTPAQRTRGVVCGSRGNHGQGLAYAGSLLKIPVTVVVPHHNNQDKNTAMRGFGARVVEFGSTYDDAVAESDRLAAAEGMTVLHSTNTRDVIAGAATITLEVLEQAPRLDAMVMAVGGGSQAVGAMAVLATERPGACVYAVQASGAPAVHESWKARRPVGPIQPATIADGIATANSYPMTLPALCSGLSGFITVSDDAIIAATRLMIRTTHNLAEPSGAVGLAGLIELGPTLAGKTVCVILSGGNADAATLKQVFAV
jgi:threonine dehydratase